MQPKFTAVFMKYERFIPLILFVLFLLVALPGISWGAPSLWNPDELVWRVLKALYGELVFDETEPDFNYPSLPKHVMYGVGWLVRAFSGRTAEIIIASRLVSVLLGGLTVVMVYLLARAVSKNIFVHLSAAFFTLTNVTLAHNARFAHNDLYLLFFLTLAVYALVRFWLSRDRLWLYLAFFSTGLAASSKYTGGGFIVVPVAVFLISHWKEFRAAFVRTVETLLIGAGLSFLGFALGTPKALFWMAYYFKRMIPAALRFSQYGRGPESPIGLQGQWGTFMQAVSAPVFCLFLASFVWFLAKWIWARLSTSNEDRTRQAVIGLLLLSIFVFDLPIMGSYNYVPRFFLPLVPMFAVLASLFLEEITAMLRQRGFRFAAPVVGAFTVSLFVYLSLHIVSLVLLFKNDARIAAGEFIRTLPQDSFVEYTLYPPSIPDGFFAGQRNYPIYFIKYAGESVPTNKAYQYNLGEESLYLRQADYLVIDDFTYGRFSDPYICETNPVECEFFTRLLAGETSLNLLHTFRYSLPGYLPQISLVTVNPEIRVYEVPGEGDQ